jgi:uncharacterized membrane protein
MGSQHMLISPSVIADTLSGFFRKYFLSPILDRTGYNWVNTTFYGLILSIAAIIAYRSVKKAGYKFDIGLFTNFLPFLMFASVIRVLVDAEIYPYMFLLVSPGIYFTTICVFGASLLLSFQIKDLFNFKLKNTFLVIGSILVFSQLVLLVPLIDNYSAGLLLLGSITIISYLILKIGPGLAEKLGIKPSKENLLVYLVHLMDATVTFIGVEFYGYKEMHILPSTLMEVFGSAAIFLLLKIMVIPVILFSIDRVVYEQDMRMFIKIILMVLGLAPALRNFLRIIVGV